MRLKRPLAISRWACVTTPAYSLALACAAFVGLSNFALLTAVAQNKTVVIVAPHPDDEALCCSGVIYSAKAQGDVVKVVVITNGDYYGLNTGYQREAETVAGMQALGLSEQDIIFLGYGDQTLLELYQSTSPSTIFTSAAGQTQTYANRGLGGVDYHTYLHGSPGPYNQQTVLSDIEAALQNLHPDEIYTTGLWDDHPDHQSTFTFVMNALLTLRKKGVALSPRVHETLIHAPCSSCGAPSNANYMWPGGGPGINPRFSPTQFFAEPYYLSTMTPYEWNRIESIPTPPQMQNTVESANLKAQIISNYASQGGSDPDNYLFSFVKKNEFFWVHDFSTNLAGLATISQSSQNTGTGQLGASAVDGFVEGDPDGYEPFEWASNGQLNGAWIRLTWPSPVTISEVALFDRPNLVDNVVSGTLHFSDGTSVSVGQLPNNGNSFLVSFSPRTVNWVQFTVDNAVGDNVGLAEIEVYGEKSGTTISEPQIFQGPSASAAVENDQYGQPYAAAITDAQTTNLTVSAFDVSGEPLTYNWSSDGGVISGTGPNVTLEPPVVATTTAVITRVTVTDSQGATARNSTFVSVTPSNSSGLVVSSLTFNPGSVASGSIVTGTVTLSSAAPTGAVVSLSSNNSAITSIPSSVNIAPGANTGTFAISTVYVSTTTAVSISASLGGATQTSSLTVLQPPVILSTFTLNPATVGGGNTAIGTITLSGPALAGGSVVALSSGQPGVAAPPPSVTIPAGSTSVTFSITTQPLSSPVSVTLSANYVGGTLSTPLRVAPYVSPNLATIATVSVSSEATAYQQLGIKAIDGIVDGSPAPGDYTKEWSTNGQLAGAWINLSWSAPVTVSQVVLYDRPNLTDNITAGTLLFSDGSTVSVGALPNNGAPLAVSFTSRTVTALTFTVNSATGQNIGLAEIAVIGSITPASTITGITVSPGNLTGGNSATGTLTLDGVAPSGGTLVVLSSSNSSVITVPTNVTVPSGATTAAFPVSTNGVGSTTQVTISGTYNGTQQTVLTVNPVALASLSLSPTMVVGGASSSIGTITLNGVAPPSGAVVALTSSNTSAAVVPVSTTITAGATSGTFTITTNGVATTSQVSISAIYNGQQNATLLVTPAVSGGGGMQQFVTDSFNRSNGILGSSWTTVLDSGSPPAIVNQTIQSSWGRAEALYYGGINWPADQYAQAQITGLGGGSVGPAVRMTSNGTFYAGTIGGFGVGNANVYILLDDNGSRSVIASSSSATVLANDYLQLSVQGDTLTLTDVTRSTTLLTATDSTVTSGYPGFYVGGSDGTALTNWSAGLPLAPLSLNPLASDNFNRANAPNLGSNWTVGPGVYAIQIVNDQIESAGQGQAPGQGHGKEYYTAVTFPTDQWSQAQVISSNGDVNGAIVRYQGTSDTHYVGFVSTTGPAGTCSVSIDRDISGAPVVIATDSTYCSVTPGDYIRLQVQGSLLSYIDVTTGSLLLTTTDTQIAGGSPGWSLNPVHGTPTAANWSGGSFQ